MIPPIDDTAFDLLRHLPYVRQENDDEPWPVYPATVGMNYTGEDYKKYGLPPHVAQLAYSKGRQSAALSLFATI